MPRAQSKSRVAVTVPVRVQAADAGRRAARRRFALVAYTGEPMRICGFDLPLVVDCGTLDVSAQMVPALLDHMPYPFAVVGQIDKVAVAAGGLPPVTAEGYFTPTDDPDDLARLVMGRADAGFQWQASVGGDPLTLEKVEAGAEGAANGRTYPGPCYIARDMPLREISFVVLGGDKRTRAVLARHRSRVRAAMNPTFEEWLASLGFQDPNALDATQLANMKILYQEEYPDTGVEPDPAAEGGAAAANDAATAAPAAGARPPAVRGTARPPQDTRPDPVVTMNRRVAANQARIDRIHDLATQYPDVAVEAAGRRVSLAAHAIMHNWTAEQTELYALRNHRPTTQAAAPAAPDRVQVLVVEAAVCLTAGLRPERVAAQLPADLRERVMNEAAAADFRGYGIQSVMDATLRAAGRTFNGSRKTDGFVRAVLEADRLVRASQGFTTISLTGVLGNVANKTLIAAYLAQAVTWREFCAVRSYSDFKVMTSYRLDMTGAFRKVGPDGELKHVGMAESGYTNQLATYGAIIALTRQMQINDDLGGFLALPTGLGRMSAVRVEEAGYVLLLSNPGSFFGAGNKNLLTGAGSALSTDGLTASEKAFMNQVDVNGKPILTMPDRLLLPTTLGVLGNTLYKDTTLVSDSQDANIVYANNPHAGKYRPVVSPYLNNTAIRDQDGNALTGQSDTAWYQFADPAVRAGVVVGFLNGQETPTIQDAETDFATLGHQWRAYHDFGFGMEDPTACVKNAGA